MSAFARESNSSESTARLRPRAPSARRHRALPGRSSSSPPRSAISRTSRFARCECCAKSRWSPPRTRAGRGSLLRHYDIQTPLVSLHEHNERQRGRPSSLNAFAAANRSRWSAMPGPLVFRIPGPFSSGLRVRRASESIPFPGRVPSARPQRERALVRPLCLCRVSLQLGQMTEIGWFDWVDPVPDRPSRRLRGTASNRRTLCRLQAILVNRPIILARELTKLHEEWWFLLRST